MIAPGRPALRYHGGKWRIGPWVISHFPAHICYVEPYGGGASVLLQKRSSKLEVYNDLSGRVVNFFAMLRDRPEELIRAIELTPYARAEFVLAREPTTDPLESARRLFILAWQGRGGPTARWNTGWRFQRLGKRTTSSLEDWNNTDHLFAVAGRLKGVHIECADALEVIARFDARDTLFYVDPPYPWSTRSKWASSKSGHAYDHELTDDDHCRLADVLHGIKGMAIVSSRPSPLYDELFAGWQTASCETQTDTASIVEERLWLNPLAAARAPQMTLPFEWGGDSA